MKRVTTQDLVDLLPSYNLATEAEEYVIQTLNTEPSREVGQYARKNVCGAYSSPSQGITIQYESHTSELAWLIRWELNADVVGFRDQPTAIEMVKADKNGVNRLSRYTPDFLVFYHNKIRVVEVKPEQALRKLSKKYPKQWLYTDGEWRYVPAYLAFEKLGLIHKVCSLSSTDAIETSNLKLLAKVQNSHSGIKKSLKDQILKKFDEAAWLPIDELKNEIPKVTSNDIYLLILQGVLFADIRKQLIGDTKSCFISSDEQMLKLREAHEDSSPGLVESLALTKVPGRAELSKALERLSRVQSDDKSRHTRRLRKRVAQGSKLGQSALQALVMHRQGSRKSKLPDVVRLFLIEHVRAHYMSQNRPKLSNAWSDYRNQAKELHPQYSPVSRNTYANYVLKQDAETVELTRGGKRAANAASMSVDVKDRAIQAVRPLERGSIDHTKLKMLVRVVESNGQVYTKKPWLTVLMDDHSGYWLSFFLTLKAPSKRSLAMLIRSCAREHGKLPEILHSDRGADFRSKYYRALLAHYGITADYSPAGHSRFNSQVERLNKQIKDQWLSHRQGNTIDYLNTRKYSKNYRPQDQANISLDDLFVEIEAFRQEYNETVVGTEAISPKALYEEGMSNFSFSGVDVNVEAEDEFLLVTSFDTNHNEYKIGLTGAILYNGLNFYSTKLDRLRPKRSSTELRIDPEDPYRIYCKVESEWITALNARHASFSGKSMYCRWAEAVRVAEGRSLRDKAKQEAKDLKTRKAKEFDNKYKESVEEYEALSSDGIDDEAIQEDFFDALKLRVIKKLESEPL